MNAVAPADRFPSPMDHHEKMRLRAAAFRVVRLYPGVVGRILAREIVSWEEFGYRLGSKGQIEELVEHVLKTPLDGPSFSSARSAS